MVNQQPAPAGFMPKPLPYGQGMPQQFARNQLMQTMQQHPGWFPGGPGAQLAGTAQGLINQWHQISQQRYQSNHPGNAVAQLFAKSAAQATQAGQNQQGQTLPGHLDPSLLQGLVGGSQGYGHPVDDQADPRAALIQGLMASLGGGRYA